MKKQPYYTDTYKHNFIPTDSVAVDIVVCIKCNHSTLITGPQDYEESKLGCTIPGPSDKFKSLLT